MERSFHDAGHGFDVFGLHPPTVASVIALTAPLYERYFRVTSDGSAHIPAVGPAILIANHGGMLPVDGAMLCLDVLRKTSRIPRPIADRFVHRLPLISTLFARCGVVSGTPANVRRLLEEDELLAIFPEGTSGPAKHFRDRYQLQDWRVGFAEHAIRHRAPIVPVAILGSEESFPLAAKLRFHAFGTPYVPLPVVPLPLPSHFHIQYGAPIELHGDPDDPVDVAAAADEVRSKLQLTIDDARNARRGVFR